MNRNEGDVDRLILELIRTGRSASTAEIGSIIERMATAPFDGRMRTVPTRERGIVFLGRPLSSREPSPRYHLFKRVVADGQWAFGTTFDDYLRDMRAAALHPAARLAVYERRGGHLAIAITATESVVVPNRRGTSYRAFIAVIHSADRSVVVSSYQATGLDTLALPEEIQWLT